ncbi:hypothetical protein [Bifidobacterium indicum]|uniref:hypothetical protein n=1 Tax=Bifidobacterium indicum TaxID=1691 RepID=UPI0030D98FE5
MNKREGNPHRIDSGTTQPRPQSEDQVIDGKDHDHTIRWTASNPNQACALYRILDPLVTESVESSSAALAADIIRDTRMHSTVKTGRVWNPADEGKTPRIRIMSWI